MKPVFVRYMFLEILVIMVIGCSSVEKNSLPGVDSLTNGSSRVSQSAQEAELLQNHSNYRVFDITREGLSELIPQYQFFVMGNSGALLDYGILEGHEPLFEKIGDHLLKMIVAAGTGVSAVTYYQLDSGQIVDAPLDVLDETETLFAYISEYRCGTITIQPIFGSSQQANVFSLDLDLTDPLQCSGEFINENTLRVTVFPGDTHLQKTVEFVWS